MSIAFNDFLAIFPPSAPAGVMEKLQAKSMKALTTETEPEKVDADGYHFALDHAIVGRQGVLKTIEKVYPPTSSSYSVGWVVEEKILYCMICDAEFGILNWKFHCRSCGYVVCGTCSPYLVPIPECAEAGEVSSKVCCNCFGFKSGRMQAATRRRSSNSHVGSKNDLVATAASSSSSSAATGGIPVFSSLLSEDLDDRDEFVVKTKAALKSFEQAQVGKYSEAYTIMRRIIPTNVNCLSVDAMCELNVPLPVAKRLWDKKVLWLIVMHKEDIAKIHVVDLRNKFHYSSLDIIEMRAIAHCLPDWGSGSNKAEWREDFMRKLNEYAHAECIHKLSEESKRSKAYEGLEPLCIFDPLAPIMTKFDKLHLQDNSLAHKEMISKANDAVDPHDYNNLSDIFGPAVSAARRSTVSIDRFDYNKLDDIFDHSPTMNASRRMTLSSTKPTTIEMSPLKPTASSAAKLFGVASHDSHRNNYVDIDDTFLDSRFIDVDEMSSSDTDLSDNEKVSVYSDDIPSKEEWLYGDRSPIMRAMDEITTGMYFEEDDEKSKSISTEHSMDFEDLQKLLLSPSPKCSFRSEEEVEAVERDLDLEIDGWSLSEMAITEDGAEGGDRLSNQGDNDDNNSSSTAEWISEAEVEDSFSRDLRPVILRPTPIGADDQSTPQSVYSNYSAHSLAFKPIEREHESSDVLFSPGTAILGNIYRGLGDESYVSPGWIVSEEEERGESAHTRRSFPKDSEEKNDEIPPPNPFSILSSTLQPSLGIDSSVVPLKVLQDDEEAVAAIDANHIGGKPKSPSPATSEVTSMASGESVPESMRFLPQFLSDASFPLSISSGTTAECPSTPVATIQSSNTSGRVSTPRQISKEALSILERYNLKDKVLKHHEIEIIEPPPPLPKREQAWATILAGKEVELNAMKAFFKSRENYNFDDFNDVFGRDIGGELLLQCVRDPDSLPNAQNSLRFILEVMKADVNIRDIDGSTPILALFTNADIGRYLLSQGANVFIKDDNNQSALELCAEFGEKWIFEAIEEIGVDEIIGRDSNKALQYFCGLAMCGYAKLASSLVDFGLVSITPEMATKILLDSREHFNSMKEPFETFELLLRLGADTDL